MPNTQCGPPPSSLMGFPHQIQRNAEQLMVHYHNLSTVHKVYLHDQLNFTTELRRKKLQINTARHRCLILRPATHVPN